MDFTTSIDLLVSPLIDDSIEYPMPDDSDALASRLAVSEPNNGMGRYSAVIQSVVETIYGVIPCRFVVYHGLDKSRQRQIVYGGCRLPDDYPAVSPLAGKIGYEAIVCAGCKTVSFQELQNSQFAATDPEISHYQLKAYLGTAMYLNNETIGILAVYHDRSQQYDAVHSTFIEQMAHLLSHAVERYEIETRLTRKINNYKLITAISATAVTAPPDKFLQYCLKKIGRWVQADGAAFFWANSETYQITERFEYWSSVSTAGIPVVEPRALNSLNIARDVLTEQKPVFCSDKAVLNSAQMKELFQGRDITLAIFLPLCSQKKTLGVCCLHFSGKIEAWEQENLEALIIVMGIIANWRKTRSISNELDESQALNSLILQLSPTAIYSVDFRTNRLISMNDYFIQYSEFTEEELKAMNPEELLVPESRESYRRRMVDAIAGRELPNNIEYQIRTKSGTQRWARMQVRFIYEDGQLARSVVVAHDITEQKKVMQELSDYRKKLEALVEERTRALSDTNKRLQQEIAIRTRTAKQLNMKSERLKELNTAMGVLLDKRKEDRLMAQEHLQVNMRQLVDPYLERLSESGLTSVQRQLLDVVRMNIKEVVGTPIADVSEKYYIFSPSELQVANLIKNGKTTKEIAHFMRLSTRTVESYRNSIRKKLGLQNRRVNLRTYLSSKE